MIAALLQEWIVMTAESTCSDPIEPVPDEVLAPPIVPDRADMADSLQRIPTAFAIDSPKAANWLARRGKEARAYADHVRAWAAAEIDRAECEERRLMERYGRQLETWLRAELAARRGKQRSIALPAG